MKTEDLMNLPFEEQKEWVLKYFIIFQDPYPNLKKKMNKDEATM